MTKNFNLSQYDSLRNTGSQGVCFIACIDWAGNNIRGKRITLKYYTDKNTDIWKPYIAQQNQYGADRTALNLSHYNYLKELLKLGDKELAISDGLSKGLRAAVTNLPVGQAIVLGIHFSHAGVNYGHAVAFHKTASGLLFFDPNLGEYTGTVAEFEALLAGTYPGFGVNTIAELRHV